MAAATAEIVEAVAPQEDDAALDEFQCIEKLESLGINRGDIKKAKDAGFHTAVSLLMATGKVLNEIRGLSEAKISKMVEAAKKLCPTQNGFMTAKECEIMREQMIVHLHTGSTALDEILDGGIESRAVTEIYGEFRCGKTQLCHTLCVTSQINEQNPGKVAYIDTEGSFRPKRIRAIAERFGVEPDSVLENVAYTRVQTYEHQIAALEPLAAMMATEPFRLVVMDSIMACFRTDFVGRGELADRQQKLGVLMARLRKLAEEFNVAVFITNHVMSDPSGGAMFISDPKKPTGGHVMAHGSTIRLSLRKGKGDQRLCKVVQAPHLPEAEASFAIGDGGIIDFKD